MILTTHSKQYMVLWPQYMAPTYLSPLSAVTIRRQLRAATQGDLDYPRTRLSHTAHGHLQFLDLHVGTYFRHP